MSIREGREPRSIQMVFVLLLLAMFAAMSTLLVTLGAQAYRATVERADSDNEKRILSTVVRSALWAEDGLSRVTVEEHDGLKALAITSTYDDESYVKRLYCHDGQLWESFTSSAYAFDVGDGESICKAAAFEPEWKNGYLVIRLTDAEGSQSTVEMQLRCAEASEE